VNGDRAADIVSFGDDGVYVARNNGNGVFETPDLVIPDFGYNAGSWRVERHPRLIGNIIAPGSADIVGFGDAGVYVARNNGDGTFQLPGPVVVANFGYAAGNWRVERHPRVLADLTGDGRDDIVGFGAEGVWVALNNGNGTFAAPRLALQNFGYDAGDWRVERHPRFVLPLARGALADIVGFGHSGVWVARNRGRGTFPELERVLDNFGYGAGNWRVQNHPRFLADITGDGRISIVGFGEDAVWVSIGNGDGTFKQPEAVVEEFCYAKGWRVERHPRFLADLTGKGRADIVGFGEQGVKVSYNNGDGTFGPATALVADFGPSAEGWQTGHHPRDLADVNGDKRADIVGFGDFGVWIFKT